MTLYILDSDHVNLHQGRQEFVLQHLADVPPDQVFATIVTVEEQMRGWLALIRKATTPERLIQSYASLHRAVAYFCQAHILGYDEAAAAQFDELRRQGIRIGAQDLRIAAIAFSVGGVVVTRNRLDFERIPGLTIEDWSKP